MAVELTIDQRTLRLNSNSIRIGRATDNEVCLPNEESLQPLHATIKQINNRWIIEASDGVLVRIDDGRPVRFAWLKSGDTIHLSENGPDLKFAFQAPLPPIPTRTAAPASKSAPPVAAETPPARSAPLSNPLPQTVVGSRSANSISRSLLFSSIIGVGLLSLLTIGLFAIPRSPQQQNASTPKTDPSKGVPPNLRQEPEPAPIDDSSALPDPAELLVLIGLGDVRNDDRPHLIGMGWLWNSTTAVVPRVLANNLREIQKLMPQENVTAQFCVIHGIALEIDRIEDLPALEKISVLKLKQPADIKWEPRKHWNRVTSTDVERLRQRGKPISYISFAKLPKAAKATGTHGISLVAYDPNLTQLVTVDASKDLEFINRGHVLKPSTSGIQTERGGLLVDQDQKIIGMTLLESSVVWSSELERALHE